MLAIQSNPTTPIDAIAHILKRVQTDSDFAWCMLGTEGLRLCVNSFAQHYSRNASELSKEIMRVGTKAIKDRPPQVKALEAAMDSLQDELDAADEDYASSVGNDYCAHELEDLLHYCRMRGERPTVEAIEAAIAGKNLAGCLSNM